MKGLKYVNCNVVARTVAIYCVNLEHGIGDAILRTIESESHSKRSSAINSEKS